MSTISRETVLIDRRQPTLRWSAVIAGAACSVGFWLLLQLLGVGVGLLVRHHADDVSTMHTARVATTVWSLVAQVIAAFFGGMVAGKLAQTYDRTLAGLHGLVTWALTSVAGLWATVWVITMLSSSAIHGAAINDAAPTLTPGADAGKGLLILGCATLISLITAVGGAMAALHRNHHRNGDGGLHRGTRTTEHGYAPPVEHTTAPYPATPLTGPAPVTGPATPVVPPTDLPR